MDRRFFITDVNIHEYQSCTCSQRLLETTHANYHYKISIGRESYFINSNGDKSGFELKEINDNDHLIFGSEDRVYIFSLITAQIKMALRTFDPISEFHVLNDHFLIFTEKLMMVFGKEDLCLHATHHFPDLIEDIIINDREVTVVCFETEPIKVRI